MSSENSATALVSVGMHESRDSVTRSEFTLEMLDRLNMFEWLTMFSVDSVYY